MKESIIMQFWTKGEISTTEIEKYQQITRFLIFLIVKMRPNIVFAMAFIVRSQKTFLTSISKPSKQSSNILKALESEKLYMAGPAKKVSRFRVILILTGLMIKKAKNQTLAIFSCLLEGP